MTLKLLFSSFLASCVMFSYAEDNFDKLLHPCSNLGQDQSIPGETTQVVMVSTDCPKDVQANLYLCEKKANSWIEKKQFLAVVGKNGIAPENTKVEGDMMTPAGTYAIGTAFGYHPLAKSAIANIKMDYKHIALTKDANGKSLDKFVDDVDSPEYNSWVVGLTSAKSFEEMRRQDYLYEYGLVLNYNMSAVKGKGSAIFMHVWRGEDKGTAGCIAMSKADIITTLKWLNKDKHPVVKVVS